MIEQVKDEHLALIVLGGVVLIKLIEYAIKYLPILISRIQGKEKLSSSKWQSFVSDSIKEIEKKLGFLFADGKINEQLTLMGILYNDHVEIDIKLDLFLLYLFKNHNGNMKEYMLGEIIKKDARKLWNNAKDRFRKSHGIIEDAYFIDSLKWVDSQFGEAK